jgi:hypothetical protein
VPRRLFGPFVRIEHEGEAMMAQANIHDRNRLSRITNLPEPRWLDGASQAEVAYQPVLWKPQSSIR